MTSQLKFGAMAIFMALAVSACSTVPEETEGSTVASIPESGPLVASNTNTNVGTITAAPRPQPHVQPNYNENTYVPAPAYNQNDYDSGYDNTVPVSNGRGTVSNGYQDENYGPSAETTSTDSSYDQYNGYGKPKAQPRYDYSGSGSSDSYAGDSYVGNSSGGGSVGNASGSFGVQVLASGNSSKAQSMKRQMEAAGLTAVVDNVGGLYKVRIPFTSRDQASSNLSRVRSLSGESGAFVTTR